MRLIIKGNFTIEGLSIIEGLRQPMSYLELDVMEFHPVRAITYHSFKKEKSK